MKRTKRLLSAVLAAAMALSLPFTALAAGSNTSAEDYGSYLDFPQFRGATMLQGVVDSKTPTSADEIEEKWKNKYGGGAWSYCGTPIIVGDYMYTMGTSAGTLNRISLATGEALKSVSCEGGSQFFSMMGYGDGKLFLPRQVGSQVVVYAYDEQTMEMLWKSEPIGAPEDSTQPLSAVTYYEGYIYVGASNGNGDAGAYACFSTKDEDLSKTDEVKQAVWQYSPESGQKGYYWSQGAIVNNAIVFGGDASELVIHSLTDDTVYDRYDLGKGAIRSAVHYDAETGRVFAATKDGYLCSIKINGDNTFDKSSVKSIQLGNNITSSPVVFKGRVYVGGGGQGSAAPFSVVDAETLDVIYQIDSIQTQSSPIISTANATEENGWKVNLYVTDYKTSVLYRITDSQNQTAQSEPDYITLVTPSVTQYCTQTVAMDPDGNIYFYNDSGNMFAFGFNEDNVQKGVYTAQDVDNSIRLAESGGAVTLNDEFAVKRIKARYDALSTAEQAKVTGLDELNAMLARIDELKDENAVIAELNETLQDLVVADVTLADDAEINALYTQYNQLSNEGKARVEHADLLQQAVDKIQGLKDAGMIAEIQAKIDALPSIEAVVYDDKASVEQVVTLLKNQNDTVKAGVDASKLDELTAKISALENAIQTLNQRIFDEINPMNVTVADKATVNELLESYRSLSESDRKHIVYADDLFYAQEVIAQLEKNNVVISEVFENLVGSDRDYTVPGKTEDGTEYRITFNGMDITDPSVAFHAGISFVSANAEKIKAIAADAIILSFAHEGALPGKATVEIAADLTDGKYFLYHFNEESGKADLAGGVTVSGGKAVFEITHCSDYFISADGSLMEAGQIENTPAEDAPQTGDNSAVLPAAVLLVLSAGALMLLRKKGMR